MLPSGTESLTQSFFEEKYKNKNVILEVRDLNKTAYKEVLQAVLAFPLGSSGWSRSTHSKDSMLTDRHPSVIIRRRWAAKGMEVEVGGEWSRRMFLS